MENYCQVCENPALHSCSACNLAFYCSKQHQKADWSKHKLKCAPYKILADKRCMVASRDIPQGATVMFKNPLVLTAANEDLPCCLSCYCEDETLTCNICEQKFCSQNCLKGRNHQEVCKYIPKSGGKFILPLKLLLLKKKTPMIFNFNVENYILDKSLLEYLTIISDKLGIGISEEDLSKILTIKKCFWKVVNSDEKNIKAFYPSTNFLRHDCTPNTRNIFYTKTHQLLLVAKVPIKKGEVLTTSYCEPLWGTLERQAFLKSKQIDCSCETCKDPTEKNHFLSSMYCRKCKDTLVVEDGPKIIATDPLSLEAPWKCQRCENEIPVKQMLFGVKNLKKEIKNLDANGLEHFLFKYGEVLPPTNSFSLRVKLSLIKLYGNNRGFEYERLPEELLDRKIQLCHELLDVLDTFDPGFSRIRGEVLYELQAAMVAQTKTEFCKELSTKFQAEEKLRESLDLLQESVKILSLEPDYKVILQKKLDAFSRGLND